MEVEVWVDVVCPWAYLSQDRSDALRDLGIEVRSRPYELHPEVPPGGVEVRAGGRLARTFERVGGECAAVGLPFRAPTRTTNSRAALEWSEAVAAVHPGAHEPALAALFAARFVAGDDPSDPAVWAAISRRLELDDAAVAAAIDDGQAARRLIEARAAAAERGVAATPAWVFPSGFVIPGVQPRDQMLRWATRLLRAAGPSGADERGR